MVAGARWRCFAQFRSLEIFRVRALDTAHSAMGCGNTLERGGRRSGPRRPGRCPRAPAQVHLSGCIRVKFRQVSRAGGLESTSHESDFAIRR